MEITKEPITKIKTIDNEIYFIPTNQNKIKELPNSENYVHIIYI